MLGEAARKQGLACHQGHGFFILCSGFQRGQVATSIIVTGSIFMSAMPWSLSFIDTRKTRKYCLQQRSWSVDLLGCDADAIDMIHVP
ncbi:uncharacterized protein K489DRAFT_383011 [Dissoconium aciculare CBS 342.82]|uniref:Uncharacterized protein n=1 Tax=Dissoconium aciculare CBS 342.82 TaxID=1314786 RepID=A0A6J3LWV0_9PEZI|nr:uncharacterized protein K489DRAFT_383011 [Dissoconium aciculare CBS 342.82]KAF1820235.1 hypothetical protein K489DRAFT_383011 [Dissoconium aciculare CBS 342.82]